MWEEKIIRQLAFTPEMVLNLLQPVLQQAALYVAAV